VLGSINVGGQHSCTAGVASTVTVAPDPSRNGAATLYVSAGNPSSFGGTWLWALVSMDARRLALACCRFAG
jgi:hypothetical protein